MIVECPSCHTRYRTDAAGVVDETTFFECSQPDCGHVFQFVPPLVQIDHLPEQDIDPEVASPEASADDPVFTSSGSFSPSDTLSTQISAADLSADQDWSDSPSPDLAPDGESEAAEATGSARPAKSARPRTSPTTPTQFIPATPRPPDTLPSAAASFSDKGHTDGGRVEQPSHPTPTSNRTVFSSQLPLLLLGLIVTGYTGVTFFASSYIEQTAVVFSHLPVLGPLLDAERPSARHIALTKMRGGFWHTKDGQRVFAIAGRAMNQATTPVQRIQIEGTLLSDSGTMLGQRLIFCGTETAPEVLESLTRRQVHILQGLMPPKQFWVAAGEGVDFLIAFTDPPERVVEFSSRVVAAQFGRSS